MKIEEHRLLTNYLSITTFGMCRGIIVGSTGYPLEVIKIKQQTGLTAQKSSKLAAEIFKSDGVRGFYRGFKPYLTRLLFRQLWLWPTIMKVHSELDRKEIHPILKQVITGGVISTVDAFTGISREKEKTLSILEDQKTSIGKGVKEPFLRRFQGVGTHWTQLSVYWTSFLVFQELFKKYYKDKFQKKELNIIEVGALGVSVAGGISVTTAPFDLANTMKQGKNISIYKKEFLKNLSKKMLGKTLLKTGGLNFTILCIHSIGSIILMEKLTKK